MPSDAIKGYVAKINSDSSVHPSKTASHADLVKHAAGLGFDFSEAEIKEHLETDGVMDSAGGGSCYANNIAF